MIFIGIDVGYNGAVAVLEPSIVRRVGKDRVDIYDAPVEKVGTRRRYMISGMVEILRPYTKQHCRALVEQQQVHPKQGGVSGFHLGEGYGLWKGILSALGIPFEEVLPSKWKPVMIPGMPAQDKGAAIIKASELFPQHTHLFTRPKQRGAGVVELHDRAEALLLAEYLRRISR